MFSTLTRTSRGTAGEGENPLGVGFARDNNFGTCDTIDTVVGLGSPKPQGSFSPIIGYSLATSKVNTMVLKTPTSALTGPSHPIQLYCCVSNTPIANELFINRLWYRTKAKIEWLLCGDAPEVPTGRSSQIAKLPQELVEIITSYFIYDTPSLLACSLTCYSWYIAVVPHLHHSLTTEDDPIWPPDRNHLWPRPLKKAYELGLLPLVKRFRVRMGVVGNPGFGPAWLSNRTLWYFSALTNLQDLGIDFLEISSFMPTIQQCFGHFSPNLRFLALTEPVGSCRQILYFIGLFPNLQDLKLHYPFPRDEPDGTVDTTFIPLSKPPMCGRLTLTCFTRENLVKDMIDFFGGLRFRRMDLFRVRCVQLLLDACTETLETLKLYPSDPYGEELLKRNRE